MPKAIILPDDEEFESVEWQEAVESWEDYGAVVVDLEWETRDLKETHRHGPWCDGPGKCIYSQLQRRLVGPWESN